MVKITKLEERSLARTIRDVYKFIRVTAPDNDPPQGRSCQRKLKEQEY